jgi:hypothetical protein
MPTFAAVGILNFQIFFNFEKTDQRKVLPFLKEIRKGIFYD